MLPVVDARVGDKKCFDAAIACSLLDGSCGEPDFAEGEGANPLEELAGQTSGGEGISGSAYAPDLNREGLEDGPNIGEALTPFKPGASVHIG